MRRIAIINQKGGVGKTTTAVNLGAALARLGRRVVVIDMDPQANASLNLAAELATGEPSTYSILTQGARVADTLRGTSTPGLSVLPAHLDLSGAELELASAIGRETILKDALDEWEREEFDRRGRAPADVVLIDNPPSLGLLSVNGLAASTEVLIAVQTEFFALQGLSKLVEIVQLLRRRMNPELEITGVLACLYDSRLRLAREVLAELRTHFPEQLFSRPIAQNVKLAETPSFSRTIFEYAPESKGADDYLTVAREFLEREGVDVNGDPRSLESRRPAGERTREHAPEDGPAEGSAEGSTEEPGEEPDDEALATVELQPRPTVEPDGGMDGPEEVAPAPEPPSEPSSEPSSEPPLEPIADSEPEPVVEPEPEPEPEPVAAPAAPPAFGAGLDEPMVAVTPPPTAVKTQVEPKVEVQPDPEPDLDLGAMEAHVEEEPLPEPLPEPLRHRGEERAEVPSRRGPRAAE
ncbi:MAG: AAA family ATPase [Planctomycetota bacterium]